ncbi:extracellular tyrosine-protein kinase PKDCC-like [Homalodisca vitripennis]|uniref:extracellular tyrosine-protein kinase PKDCC-like n=1 Tax=Homalodisca vitripennis TaxID=197043 RepID=UPI001EECCDA2|nr:extracellular tyrosine-protein kinase PKDCC-like [Homalodisca vitripennis]
MQLSMSPFLQLRSSGVCLFVSVYFFLFLIASVVLFSPIFRTSLDHRPISTNRNSRSVFSEDDYEWENSLFLNLSGFSSLSGAPRGLRWPVTSPGPINCSTLNEVKDLEFIAAGWTKAVYKGMFRGEPVAIKTVNLNGHDFRQCQERQPQASLASCYRRTAAKLLKELILLTELSHENIIKVVGSCVPDAVGPVVIATELGDPLDTVQLLQLSWERRLKLVHGVARLLYHLAHSPLGSLAMNDLRRQQFVLADGVLKLSDVDDMGIAEPFCQTDADCSHHLLANISNRAAAPCVDGQCRGHNERLNVWRAGQHFVKQLLPLRAPSSLEPQIQLLLEAYSDTSWSSQKILTATEMLLQTYSADHSSRSETRHYRHFPDSGLGAQFDYWCQQSESPIACRLTVDSQREAVSLCNLDLQCRAVVVEPFQSLKDKIQVTLKNGFSTPSSAPGSLLLLKPS